MLIKLKKLTKLKFTHLKLMFTLGVVLIGVSSCQASGWGSDGTAPIVSPAAGGGLTNFSYCNVNYDFYLGRVGAFADPSNFNDYNAPASSGYDLLPNIDAAEDSWNSGHGVGAGAYVFLSGPQYAYGTAWTTDQTPYNWGVQQAQWAEYDYRQALASVYASGGSGLAFLFIMGDIEPSPTKPYGWDPGTSTANITANQQVWEGFVNQLQNSGINVMLYSSPDVWSYYFNNYTVTTVEDTFQQDAGPYSPCPSYPNDNSGPSYPGVSYTNAQWFDVTNTNNELVWQWSQKQYNGVGDFDIINITNYNTLFNTADNP
jgi:hypothetical protein